MPSEAEPALLHSVERFQFGEGGTIPKVDCREAVRRDGDGFYELGVELGGTWHWGRWGQEFQVKAGDWIHLSEALLLGGGGR